MILDTSALVAILFEEPEAENFAGLILAADVCRLSVVSHLELAIVLERQARPDAARQAEAFLRAASIVVEPVTVQQRRLGSPGLLRLRAGKASGAAEFRRLFRLRTG